LLIGDIGCSLDTQNFCAARRETGLSPNIYIVGFAHAFEP
jgi:hypothetical protein